MRRTTRVLTLAVVLAACAVGCGGPRFDGSVYRGDGFAFRVPPLAPGWERVEQTHAALTFRDRANRASILVNGRCGLDGDDVPLGALTNHLFLQFTERDIETQEVVPFDGREAMHTRMSAKLDGVPLRYDVWVLKKDGCVYDLLYMAPQASFETGLAPFTRLVKGFGTVSDGA